LRFQRLSVTPGGGPALVAAGAAAPRVAETAAAGVAAPRATGATLEVPLERIFFAAEPAREAPFFFGVAVLGAALFFLEVTVLRAALFFFEVAVLRAAVFFVAMASLPCRARIAPCSATRSSIRRARYAACNLARR